MAGLSAYETVFNFTKDTTNYRMRMVTVENNNFFYSTFFSTDPASYDKLNQDFDTVVSSFAIN